MGLCVYGHQRHFGVVSHSSGFDLSDEICLARHEELRSHGTGVVRAERGLRDGCCNQAGIPYLSIVTDPGLTDAIGPMCSFNDRREFKGATALKESSHSK